MIELLAMPPEMLQPTLPQQTNGDTLYVDEPQQDGGTLVVGGDENTHQKEVNGKKDSDKKISSVIVVDDEDDYIFTESSSSPLDPNDETVSNSTNSENGARPMKNMINLKHMNPEERTRLLTELEGKRTSSGVRLHSLTPPPSSKLAPPSSIPSVVTSPASSSSSSSSSTGVVTTNSSSSKSTTSPPPQTSSTSILTDSQEVSPAKLTTTTTTITTTASTMTVGEQIPSAVRSYFLFNFLDEPVPSGFYAVPREFVQLPPLSELRLLTPTSKPPFNSTLTHIFVIDFTEDRIVALRKETSERLAATRSKRFAAKIKELLVVLREHFPYSGPYAAHTEISHLTKEHNSMVLSVGSMKKLSHEELAILFKVLCEDAGIDCRTVRGKNPQNKECAWAFVREDPWAKWQLVSVVNATMSPTNSLEAVEYTMEGTLTGNGIPPDGPFPPPALSLQPQPINPSVPLTSSASLSSSTSAGLSIVGKPKKPVIKCVCHVYEETSPMLTCNSCRSLMHGPCHGFTRLEDLPSTFKCPSCIANPPPPPSARIPVVAIPTPVHPATPVKEPSLVGVDPGIISPKSQPMKLKLVLKTNTGTSIETKRDFNMGDNDADDDDSDVSNDDSSPRIPEMELSERTSSRQLSDNEDGDNDDDEDEDDDPAGLVAYDDDDGNWGGGSGGGNKGAAIIHRTSSSGSEKKRGRPSKIDSKRAQKPKPDPHAPQRPISCYHIFCKEVREDLLKTRTDVSYPVIGQIAGDRWKKLPEEQRQVYIQRAKEQKQTYARQLSVYKETIHYKDYQRYLGEYFAQRPAASRKRTLSEAATSPVADHAPQTPARNEPSKKHKATPVTPSPMITRKASTAGVESPITPRRGPDSHPGAIARRRTSSIYDIDDFLPNITASTVITPLKVKEVFVPNWRERGANSRDSDNDEIEEEEVAVSTTTTTQDIEEDDSDEAYQKRHEKFENAEKNRLPLPIERRFSVNLSPLVEKQSRKKKTATSTTPTKMPPGESQSQQQSDQSIVLENNSNSLESTTSGDLAPSASSIIIEAVGSTMDLSPLRTQSTDGGDEETQNSTPMEQE